MMFCNRSALLLGAVIVLGACNSPDTQSSALAGSFNTNAVSGTMTLPDAGEAIQLEDYELTSPSGDVQILNSCDDVLNLSEPQTVPREYYFYRKYAVECRAAQEFVQGKPSKSSYMSGSLADIFPSMPAMVSPNYGEAAVFAERKGKTYLEVFGEFTPTSQSSDTVSVVIDGAEVDYTLLGRRDINNDGIEDILLDMSYSLIEGSGRGVQLFAISKTSDSAPAEILWDFK